jgi:TatD DNase family protein
MILIDIGANLTHKSFNTDRESVLDRAWAAGVPYIIVTGTNLASSEAAIKLATRQPMLRTTVGIHPHDAKTMTPEVFKRLAALAHLGSACAIGECGLDFNRMFSTQEEQINAFELQLALAQDVSLPLFLHERDAVDKFTEMLTLHSGKIRGVVHCFTGNTKTLKAYLDLGMYIGITGWICDERRNQDVKDAIKYLPLDRMLVETDAPF